MPTIIFKATEKCNSNCVYCDVVARKAPKSMSLELLERVFKEINAFLTEKPHETITLIWHGGEPLLLGVDYFKKAAEMQKEICPNTADRIEHAVQSNVTLLTQEFIDVFRSMNINQVGTSYEFLPNVRGPGAERNSEWYNKKFFQGVELMNRNRFGWGFIYVITRKSLENPIDLFYHLSNIKPGVGFMMNPVLVYGEDESNIGITPIEYSHFLGKILPEWWKNRHRFPNVGPFDMYLKNINDKGCSLGCCDSGNCTNSHVYIGPDGETSQCGRAGDWSIISYGNINEKSLSEVLFNEQRTIISQRTEVLKDTECKDCRFWEICHGGCPLDSYTVHQSFMHKSYWCSFKKHFLTNYFEPITGLKF